MKSKTKSQKKARAAANHVAQEAYSSVPHSFVFHRGQIGKNVGQLILDVRKVMEPYTAESLKVRRKNVLKDFVAVAGPLGVTHFMIFNKTPSSVNMRVARLPKGPMLHFRVLKYSLIKDVVSTLKKHRMHDQQFTHHPLLVLNNFGSDGMQVKLMATMFQHMFPSINVHKVNLNNIKRCVLLNYNTETKEIEFRHYSLKVVPVGMSRGVKKLMQEKFPNMSKFEDISELLMKYGPQKGANLSESEAEQDGEHNITELPQAYSGRGNMASQQSAVRLTEIGPRMTLQLTKIEEGMGEGNVLYHSMISKSEEEIQELLNRKEVQLKEKEERRKHQEQNVTKKKEKREENKKKSLEGMKRKRSSAEEDSEVEDPGMQNEAAAAESDDEVEYYRQAVGAEPDEDIGNPAQTKMNNFDCVRFQLALLPSVYGFVFILALVGNLLALWLLVARQRRNWHTGVVLSCNLAVSDLLYILTLPLLIIYYSRGKEWTFGVPLCKIEKFLFTCNIYVSIFFIMAISVNRCVALKWPFFARSHVKPAQVKVISVIIWIVVGLISCPVFKFSSTCKQHNKTLCVSYCDYKQDDVNLYFKYKLFLGVFGCFVPFLVTFTSYCVVIHVVWRNVNITSMEKCKVALLVASVLVLYVFSFLPYNILLLYHLYQKIQPNENSSCWVFDMYQVSKGLASLNMCIHPILYMAVIDGISLMCCRRTPKQKQGTSDRQELSDNL
ncbi:Suppressor of SWI4 1 -like protein [Takifugu flavidus]|uniref:Suppressor of SWI4 1-like protein n=1 Tax=Takifugu flavidus TaxID=433684 RepID=A0A5C6NUB9_9TELE|nr:Suppressor of SWI4 1 -like protein [Takifugu flavidus]